MDRPPTRQREDPGGKRVETSESFIGERKGRLDEETPEQPKVARKKEISVALRLSAYTARNLLPLQGRPLLAASCYRSTTADTTERLSDQLRTAK